MKTSIHFTQASDRAVAVRIQGDIDMNGSTQVQSYLTDLFKNNPRGIIVDLSKVTFINSFGLAILVEGLQWSHHNHTKFRLTGLSSMVRDVFSIAKLLPVFEIYESTENALDGI